MAKNCPTGKIVYKRKQDARNALCLIKLANDPTRRERNIYQCGECGKWHLTSRPRHAAGKAIQPYYSMEELQRYADSLRGLKTHQPKIRKLMARRHRVDELSAFRRIHESSSGLGE